MEKIGEKLYYSSTEIAKLFSVTTRRIQQLAQDGIIEMEKTSSGKKYVLDETVTRYIKYLSDKAKGKEKSITELGLKEQKLRAEIALKESQGELHRLRTEIAIGKYIPTDVIKADYSRFFISFKNFAMSIPNKIAGRLSGFVDPVEVRRIESEMQKDIKKMLKGFILSAEIEEKTNAKT